MPDTTMHNPQQAVVIGGGIAGLTAALCMAESGRWRPLVIERENVAGGLARSLDVHGLTSDLGPHRIHTEIPEVSRFIDRVAQPSLMRVRRRSRIYLRGKYLPYPPNPIQMAMHLGPLRMAGFTASFLAQKLGGGEPDETYDSLMRRAFGKSLYDFLLRPYSAKTWKIDPAELHADTARVRISAGNLTRMLLSHFRREQAGSETALKEFRYVRGGAQSLVRHLLESAEAIGTRFEPGREVRALRLDEHERVSAAIHAATNDEDERAATGDVYLSTAPLPILLGKLLPEIPSLAEARRAAAGLEYLNMIFVFLIVDRPRISDDNWLYFPEPHLIFNRGYEAKNFDASLGPDDKTILCLEITTRAGDALEKSSDDDLAAQAVEQIVATGLIKASEIVARAVQRIPFAYPLYKLDYKERLDAAFAGLARVENLVTLGRQGLFNHNNMDHSIWMGMKAAEALNSTDPLEGQRTWYANVERFKKMRIVD
ncbi:FAD-dependent oxidoreductase [bacterium]|nr:FAD-dependent oxidoreductase [bacterium]